MVSKSAHVTPSSPLETDGINSSLPRPLHQPRRGRQDCALGGRGVPALPATAEGELWGLAGVYLNSRGSRVTLCNSWKRSFLLVFPPWPSLASTKLEDGPSHLSLDCKTARSAGRQRLLLHSFMFGEKVFKEKKNFESNSALVSLPNLNKVQIWITFSYFKCYFKPPYLPQLINPFQGKRCGITLRL